MNALDQYALKRRLMFALEKHAGITDGAEIEKQASFARVLKNFSKRAPGWQGRPAGAVGKQQQQMVQNRHNQMLQGSGLPAQGSQGVRRTARFAANAADNFLRGVGRTTKRIGRALRQTNARVGRAVKGVVSNVGRAVKPVAQPGRRGMKNPAGPISSTDLKAKLRNARVGRAPSGTSYVRRS